MKIFGRQFYFHKHDWKWKLNEYKTEHGSYEIQARLVCDKPGCQEYSAKGVIRLQAKNEPCVYFIDTTFDKELTD